MSNPQDFRARYLRRLIVLTLNQARPTGAPGLADSLADRWPAFAFAGEGMMPDAAVAGRGVALLLKY